jgi:hypothetical protein
MKKPNFTHAILSQLGMENVKKTFGAFSILITLTFIFSNHSFAQVDCNSVMACGKKVNISVDDQCTVVIEPDMVTDDQAYPNVYYDVEARLNGQLLPSVPNLGSFNGRPIKRPAVTSVHVGKTLEVKVILRGCSNSCWGFALIEDKLAPEATTCPCVERITRFRDTIYGDGPIYGRPISSICEPGGAGFYLNSDFRVFRFALTEDGRIDVNINPITGLPTPAMTIYEGAFDANRPCLNKVTSHNGTSFSDTLEAGVNYFLVIAIADGIIDVPVNVAIEHRNGHIVPSANDTVCAIKCQGEGLLLAQNDLNAQNKPLFEDNCTTVTTTKSDVIESLGCESRFSKIIKRTWKAKDIYGNESDPKTQIFYVERIQLSEVNCPDKEVVLECTSDYPRLANGAPDPEYTGKPTNLNCQNIQVWYDDFTFPLCGAGVKLSRTWHIIDWCSGEEKECSQGIALMDTKGPEVRCPADITTQSGTIRPAEVVPVNADNCTATWTVIPPTLVKDCSKVTWEVAFKKADSNGLPPANTTYVKLDGNTRVVGTQPAFATTIISTVRPFRIENLPLGRTWLRYTITDECGNSSNCFSEVDVVDRTAPTAVCDGTTVVSIDDTGIAEVFAESIDDYSRDNCGVVKFEIKRNTPACTGFEFNNNFGPSVKVCCKDFSAPNRLVPVTLRVYDAAGNFNDCETNLLIQLKRQPAVQCPGPRSVSCSDPRLAAWASGTSHFDTIFFGRPTLSGICINSTRFTSRIISDTRNAKCGVGVLVREWTLVGDPSVNCQQTINVSAPTFGYNNIIFPKDTILNSCDLAAAEPEILKSNPIIANQACRDLGVSKTDKYFYDAPEACIKIVRTWKVIDWCTYPQTNQVFEQVQKILLKGSDAPQFRDCKDITVNTESNKCDTEVTMTARATDACTDSLDIRYTWRLDINNDGSFNANGLGNRVTRTLEVGTHSITFTAENRCGKTRDCKYKVIVKSNKKPTPICLSEVVWVLDASGTTEVWASDFNRKSEGACGSTGNLKFSFDEAGLQTAKTFTCADIPNGQVARIPLRMYVTDSFGNFEYCDVILILQDSPLNNKCRDISSLLPIVQGRIATELDKGLQEVEVKLTNTQSSDIKTAMTGNQGGYIFDGVDVFDPKTIEATDDTDHLNGVSTLDLVMMQRHILGISKLTSPYKLLAADINNSRSITASDLVNLRKLILGITNEFENNQSWRFVPANYVFLDPTSPFDYPSRINLDSIYDDKNNINFVAVKVGDVNNSIVNNVEGGNVSNRTRTQLMTYSSSEYRSGDVAKIDIKTGSDMEMIGAQMAIKYDDQAFTFKAIESQGFEIKPNQYIAKDGVIKLSADIAKGLKLKSGEVIMTLVFVANQSTSIDLTIDQSSDMVTELYDGNANAAELDLQSRVEGQNGDQNILYQNEPNPFKDITKIAFELQNAGEATVRVMDVNGKIVFETIRPFDRGYNVVSINSNELNTSGVYYYQVETEGFSDTKKMILIK